MNFDIIIVGAGVFGVTAAIELKARGFHVGLFDPGPLPHPLAASTDISKVIRMEYGKDKGYMEMVEEVIPKWRDWNEEFERPLFHETGVAMFTQDEMAIDGFEYESYQMLLKRGHKPQKMDSDEIHLRFPAWKHGIFVDGFYHSVGGFAESGKVIEALIQKAKKEGVDLKGNHKVNEILLEKGKVFGIKTADRQVYHSGMVIIAAGAWTPHLIPELQPMMKISGHPVFHLKVKDNSLFSFSKFPVFTADVARTGWYGFPAHPDGGVIKISNHGVGQVLHPEHDQRIVTMEDENKMRTFLKSAFPLLAYAKVAFTRRCLYCDTHDEHFWIDHHPEKEGLIVASGGSGHGFKFAPILGKLIADCVEHQANPWLSKFKWRTFKAGTKGEEAARFHG